MAAPTLARLGDISVARFMREYWQRKPLLVRGAFPDLPPPVDRAGLFRLAARDDVESRLVVRHGRRWSLRDGPFGPRALPPRRQPAWTLLVQGLDLVDGAAHELMSRFRFIPDARLDDLMASFATDGGGVGPHVDNYDVFLLQASGRRRWRISAQRGLPVEAGQPLKLLAGFRPSQEWLLGAGDMLYLPPGIAHDGVAEGECITCSIGFRAPTWQELLDPWLAHFAEAACLQGRYSDPGQRPVRHPAALPPAMVREAHAALSRARPDRAGTERFLLERLSEPKSQVVFAPAARRPSSAAFARRARRRGVVLDRRSRMLTGRSGSALNGEFFAVARDLRPVVQRLADQRFLDGSELAKAPSALMTLLREWLLAGWLAFGPRG